jgi:hypothetical protein
MVQTHCKHISAWVLKRWAGSKCWYVHCTGWLKHVALRRLKHTAAGLIFLIFTRCDRVASGLGATNLFRLLPLLLPLSLPPPLLLTEISTFAKNIRFCKQYIILHKNAKNSNLHNFIILHFHNIYLCFYHALGQLNSIVLLLLMALSSLLPSSCTSIYRYNIYYSVLVLFIMFVL